GRAGVLECASKPALRALPSDLEPSVQPNEQSNTSINYGGRVMLKLIRRVEAGIHPQVELEELLSTSAVADNIPKLLGTAAYRDRAGRSTTIAVAEGHVQHQSDGWLLAVDELGTFLEGVGSAVIDAPYLPADAHPLDMLEPGDVLSERMGDWFSLVAALGRRTAELHTALSEPRGLPDFAPEAYSLFFQRGLAQGFRTQARRTLLTLKSLAPGFDEAWQPLVDQVRDAEVPLMDRFQELASRPLTGKRIRGHGDLHLGQVLTSGADWVFIDFEGEPSRSLGERRVKRSPLRDVAGMVRSFYYASEFSLRRFALDVEDEARSASTREWCRVWYLTTSATFLRAYLDRIAPAGVIATDPAETRFLLDTFMLDKAFYELSYEMDNRPSWVDIALRGVVEVLRMARNPGAKPNEGTSV
ncbi:MAG: hypothetical protein ABI305_00195, partial [Tepidiformaceae bacterium]